MEIPWLVSMLAKKSATEGKLPHIFQSFLLYCSTISMQDEHLNPVCTLKHPSIKLLAVFCLVAGTAFGQSDTPLASPDSALIEALAKIEGTPLVLTDFINLAVANSTTARDAEASLAAARGALMKQRGVFDPELFAEISKSSEKQPASSPFAGASVVQPKTTAGEAGVRLTLPVGTEIQASMTGQKLETNSSFASLSPEYDADAALTIRQPLLNGFGPASCGDFAAAKAGYDAAKHRYEDVMAGLRATAEEWYWDLYAAERDLAVATLTRDQATALLKEAEIRGNTGLVGPNQVNNARVFAADQELNVLDAEDNLSRISDGIASLINSRPGDASRRYRTLDEPPTSNAAEPVESILARAMNTNHAITAAGKDVAAMRAYARGAFWNALPTADAFGALGGNGLSGTGRDVIFGEDTLRNSLDTKFSDALDQALNRDYPTWTIGLRVSVPILLRENRGERNRLRAEVVRAEQLEIDTKNRVEDHIRAVYRELEKGQDRLRAAEQGVTAARDQVRIGLIQFKNGTTTAFELVRLGADFANAQRRYSQALVRTAKASARLRQLVPDEAP